MFCKMCGKKIQDESRFCPYCGASVGKIETPVTTEEVVIEQEEPEKQLVEEAPVQTKQPEQNQEYINVKKGLDPKLLIIPVAAVAAVAVAAGVWIGLGKKAASKEETRASEYATEVQTQAAEESTEMAEEETKLAVPFAEGGQAEVSEGITPEEYILPECETRTYTKEELSVLSADELRLARNEIYARHGRMFNSEDLKNYFQSKSWYTPQYEGSEFDAKGDSILNEYEIANRDLLVELEENTNNATVTTQRRTGYAGMDTYGRMMVPGVSMAIAILDDVYRLYRWTIFDSTEWGEVSQWTYTGDDIYISKNAKFDITVFARDYFGTGDFYEVEYPHEIFYDGENSTIHIYDLSFLEFRLEMGKVKKNSRYGYDEGLYMEVEFDENGIITGGYFQDIAG